MTVYAKLLDAQKAIKHVAKNGRNNFQGYDYATEADVLDQVKTVANENGLVITTSAYSEIGIYPPDPKGKSTRWAKVTLTYKVTDAETGETLEGSFDGYAEDSGDKAIYKATTGANKYFLMKFFGVPTGDDPEKDEKPGSAASGNTENKHLFHNPDMPELSNPELKKQYKAEMAAITNDIRTFRESLKLTLPEVEALVIQVGILSAGQKISERQGKPKLEEIRDYLLDLLHRNEKGNLTDQEMAVMFREEARSA